MFEFDVKNIMVEEEEEHSSGLEFLSPNLGAKFQMYQIFVFMADLLLVI